MELLLGIVIGVVIGAVGYKFFLPLLQKLWVKVRSLFGKDDSTNPA